MVPLILDLRGRTVIIMGGGPVGARKAAFFRGECRVVVASRSFAPEILGMDAERVEVDLKEAGDAALLGLMEGAFLVVAATGDPGLNNRILGLCRASGILCNTASGGAGDVVIPSVERGRSHLVAVTTFGRSPAMARYIRERVTPDAGPVDGMIEIQARLRGILKDREPSQERRSALLWRVIQDPSVWKALETGGDAAWELVKERYLHA